MTTSQTNLHVLHITSALTLLPCLPHACHLCLSVFNFFRAMLSSKRGVPNLRNLMPDDLRWNWCNINKMHNKHNAVESSPNHHHLPGQWKNCFPWNQCLVPKILGNATLGVLYVFSLDKLNAGAYYQFLYVLSCSTTKSCHIHIHIHKHLKYVAL